MSRRSKIHLVSYATPQFRHRQIILGLSARLNRVVDTVTAWTPARLKAAGFEKVVSEIGLNERGGGFWSWKPFIIQKRLSEVPEGDFVVYCDVGRFFPYRILDQPIDPFLQWMEKHQQEVMPGVLIPWHGPMSVWTKRDVFVSTGTDTPDFHRRIPIEATFSIWKAGAQSRRLADEWMDLCSQRRLISDDPITCGLPELPGFRENRHDQTLWSICCFKEGLQALSIGEQMPPYDYRTPSKVGMLLWPEIMKRPALTAKLLGGIIAPLQVLEKKLRRS
jgi:hypothetical protein